MEIYCYDCGQNVTTTDDGCCSVCGCSNIQDINDEIARIGAIGTEIISSEIVKKIRVKHCKQQCELNNYMESIKKYPDFKCYYDSSRKVHYWVLGYFGSPFNIMMVSEVGKLYADEYNVPIDTVFIDRIYRSSRFLGSAYVYSSIETEPKDDSEIVGDVFKWLLC